MCHVKSLIARGNWRNCFETWKRKNEIFHYCNRISIRFLLWCHLIPVFRPYEEGLCKKTYAWRIHVLNLFTLVLCFIRISNLQIIMMNIDIFTYPRTIYLLVWCLKMPVIIIFFIYEIQWKTIIRTTSWK